MLSTFPALQPSDSLLGIHFPAFEPNFSAWDFPDPFSSLSHLESDLIPTEPVLSNSGSDNSTPESEPVREGTLVIDERKRRHMRREGTLVIDERKRRRMISNRDSARRSRMRKQKHLENLRNQTNRLRVVNRELVNRLHLFTHHARVVRIDNEWLRTESIMLRQRLWTVEQVIMVRGLQNQNPNATWLSNNITSLINQ